MVWHLDQTIRAGEGKGKKVIDYAREKGFNVASDATELDAVTEANQDKPVLGLFSEGNMPVRWEGPKAEKNGYLEEAAKCTDTPERTADVPKLADMTEKAIDLLKVRLGLLVWVRQPRRLRPYEP